MMSILKLGAKLAVVGTAVYITVDNSIWDKSEYANTAINKVKTSLPETTELVKTMPSSNKIADNWNQGVEKVFRTVSNSSQCLSNSANKLLNFATGKEENSK